MNIRQSYLICGKVTLSIGYEINFDWLAIDMEKLRLYFAAA